MERRIRITLCFFILAGLLLAACGSAAPSGGSGAAPTAAGGSESSGGGNQVVVTQADSGKTIQMKVGQQLLVKMGTDEKWKVDVTPAFLLPAVADATLGEGEQGLFEAKMNGKATVQVTGGSKQFNISIEITQ